MNRHNLKRTAALYLVCLAGVSGTVRFNSIGDRIGNEYIIYELTSTATRYQPMMSIKLNPPAKLVENFTYYYNNMSCNQSFNSKV